MIEWHNKRRNDGRKGFNDGEIKERHKEKRGEPSDERRIVDERKKRKKGWKKK